MRRLYHKVYLTIILSLFLVVLVAGGLWRFGGSQGPNVQALDIAGELASALLPPVDAPGRAQQESIEWLSHRLKIDLALYDENLTRIAAAGAPLPSPGRRPGGGWLHGPGGPAWSFRLPDQRWIVARAPTRHRHPAIGLVLFLGGITLAVGIGAYPVVRGLTRRLERLQTGVDTLGSGQLGARVKVEGRDEVARLAESFNRAASRIEHLVGAHRLLLANASHELRTPLSRIRLGVELFEKTKDEKYKTELERDIAELDSLIDEILLASRLDATQNLQTQEDVDLLALAAEEGARYPNCTLDGEAVTISGDPRLMRRLIRNLLENAYRHGREPVRVTLRREGGNAILNVIDSGDGIPSDERTRIFEPFTRLRGGTIGTGLGLSLVRQIARLHGGDVTVPDEQQSCFRITVPAR